MGGLGSKSFKVHKSKKITAEKEKRASVAGVEYRGKDENREYQFTRETKSAYYFDHKNDDNKTAEETESTTVTVQKRVVLQRAAGSDHTLFKRVRETPTAIYFEPNENVTEEGVSDKEVKNIVLQYPPTVDERIKVIREGGGIIIRPESPVNVDDKKTEDIAKETVEQTEKKDTQVAEKDKEDEQKSVQGHMEAGDKDKDTGENNQDKDTKETSNDKEDEQKRATEAREETTTKQDQQEEQSNSNEQTKTTIETESEANAQKDAIPGANELKDVKSSNDETEINTTPNTDEQQAAAGEQMIQSTTDTGMDETKSVSEDNISTSTSEDKEKKILSSTEKEPSTATTDDKQITSSIITKEADSQPIAPPVTTDVIQSEIKTISTEPIVMPVTSDRDKDGQVSANERNEESATADFAKENQTNTGANSLNTTVTTDDDVKQHTPDERIMSSTVTDKVIENKSTDDQV